MPRPDGPPLLIAAFDLPDGRQVRVYAGPAHPDHADLRAAMTGLLGTPGTTTPDEDTDGTTTPDGDRP